MRKTNFAASWADTRRTCSKNFLILNPYIVCQRTKHVLINYFCIWRLYRLEFCRNCIRLPWWPPSTSLPFLESGIHLRRCQYSSLSKKTLHVDNAFCNVAPRVFSSAIIILGTWWIWPRSTKCRGEDDEVIKAGWCGGHAPAEKRKKIPWDMGRRRKKA